MHIKHQRIKDIIVVVSVLCVLVVMTISAWIKPAKEFSDSERRYLDQLPACTLQSLVNGSFMSAFEEYTVDQFPGRDIWRGLKSEVALNGFGQKDIHDIYCYKGYLSKMEYPLNIESLDRAGRVFQGIYEKYLEDSDTNVYFSIIPDKNCFMAEESGHLSLDYNALYDYMTAKTSYMKYIDIVSLLELTDYYKTDTHWRQERIEDVASLLLNEMGAYHGIDEETYRKTMYEKKVLEKEFFGVYVGQSGLSVPGEELYYLDDAHLQACKVFDHEHQKETSIYDMEKANGKDPYEMFLSGPLSLITIENPNAVTEKELIIFRDSFGSALAPLMVEPYAKVTLVDIRYMPSSLLDKWITFDHQDVLFLYSTQVLNNSETMK